MIVAQPHFVIICFKAFHKASTFPSVASSALRWSAPVTKEDMKACRNGEKGIRELGRMGNKLGE